MRSIDWWIRIKLTLIVACGMILVSCQSSSNVTLIKGKVTKVISGQTLEVVLPEIDRTQQVRIIGIEAPDLQQSPWGEAAKQKCPFLLISFERATVYNGLIKSWGAIQEIKRAFCYQY